MTSYHVAIDGIQTNDPETLRILVNKLAAANEGLRAGLAGVTAELVEMEERAKSAEGQLIVAQDQRDELSKGVDAGIELIAMHHAAVRRYRVAEAALVDARTENEALEAERLRVTALGAQWAQEREDAREQLGREMAIVDDMYRDVAAAEKRAESAEAALAVARRDAATTALREAADAIQALHPGEVKASVTFLRGRASMLASQEPGQANGDNLEPTAADSSPLGAVGATPEPPKTLAEALQLTPEQSAEGWKKLKGEMDAIRESERQAAIASNNAILGASLSGLATPEKPTP